MLYEASCVLVLSEIARWLSVLDVVCGRSECGNDQRVRQLRRRPFRGVLSMRSQSYRIETVSASSLLGTDIQAAATTLAATVSALGAEGWQPAGGVAVAVTPVSKELVLLQALVKPEESA